ncbi:Bacterial Ig-like domain (group 1) [compost metagenome]
MLVNELEISCERGRRQIRGASPRSNHQVGECRHIVRGALVGALLLGLAGCGGSDDGDSGGSTPPTTPPTSQVRAVDGFSVVRPGVTTLVDLSTYVHGTGVTLSSVSSDKAGCSASNLDGLSAEVTSDSGLCVFTYKVAGQGGDASATLNTFASTLASPVLPPLSQTMTLAEPTKTFDLVALLGADWPTGYTLDPASVEAQGGSVQGTVTASDNKLTYTHPGEPVWNRIIFTLTDPIKPGEDVFGTLYVTVSDSINKPPVIGAPKYDYNAQGGAPIVSMQSVTLDLATLANLDITEPDGDEWQLVEVQSYSASVAPVDPNSVTNKKFTFGAGAVGDHIVSYIVGDHEAGFATGLIKITVGADESPKTWNDISVGSTLYLATPLYSEVIARGVIAEAVYDDVVANTVAGVTSSAARSYCSNGNHLATKEELDTLRMDSAVTVERVKYPTERTYITNDGAGQWLTYELNSGVTSIYDSVSSPTQYVICVSDAAISYAPAVTVYGADTGLSDTAWWSLGTLQSVGGATISTLVSSTNIGPTTLSVANVRLNPAGCPLGTCKVEVQGDPTTYGQFTVQVANSNNATKTVDIPLVLLQDAKVVAAAADVNNSLADGSATNTILVSVVDKDSNPVADTQIKLRYTVTSGNVATVTIDPSSEGPVTTNAAGQATMSLKATAEGDYTITLPSDAVVGGLSAEPIAEPTCDAVAGADQGSYATPDGQPRLWVGAYDYCASLGMRLPLKDELLELYNAYPNNEITSVCGWQSDYGYWTSSSDTPGFHTVVLLDDGNFTDISNNIVSYVACVR